MVNQGSSWRFETIHRFSGAGDGDYPIARVVFGPDGKLYGTTFEGGPGGNGTVFRLAQPPNACRYAPCPWTESTLYAFGLTHDPTDGANPRSDLIFDSTGNVYGTTTAGGDMSDTCYGSGCGTAFELSPSQGTWSRTTLYSFVNGDDHHPSGGLIFDRLGNLYGATPQGIGSEMYGTVLQLTPGNPNWSRTLLHSFSVEEGWGVIGDLISDSAGNVCWCAPNDGAGGGGMVFELSPSGSGWNFMCSIVSLP